MNTQKKTSQYVIEIKQTPRKKSQDIDDFIFSDYNIVIKEK